MMLSRFDALLLRIGFDRYLLALVSTIILAALLPAQGGIATALSRITYWAVALLFFLYGAKLSLAAIWAGLTNWKLQFGCLAATYLMFPVLAFCFQTASSAFLPAAVLTGILYIGCLPSTVQSSIAFTSMAEGNVAGAVCAASLSNLLGVLLAPMLLAVLLHVDGGGFDFGATVWKIAVQILFPFILGQLCRPLLANLLARHKVILMLVDRGSILLIVYTAFSAGVIGGIWHILSLRDIVLLISLCLALLFIVIFLVIAASRSMGLNRADKLSLLFCGSTKSLATGLPMAGIIFPQSQLAMTVLPLMLYHLLQLAVLAVYARRQRPDAHSSRQV